MIPTRFAAATILSGTLALGACDAAPGGPDPQSPPAPPPAGRWVVVAGVPVGAWSAALLPTGKVLLFQGGEQMHLWDPNTWEFGARFSSNTNLFCAGLTLLADGRLLAVGGHAGQDSAGNFLGSSAAEVFDPWQERWTRLPDMIGGERWYPTAITLPDGRVLVASGTHAGKLNETIERFDPEREEWQAVARQQLPLYPWAAVLPADEIAFYGPQRPTALFDLNTGAIRPAGSMGQARHGGTGVLLNAAAGRLLALGGGSPATGSAEMFEVGSAAWRPIPSMARSRHHPDTILLPDGTVLVVGGHSTAGEGEGSDAEGDVRLAEILDPTGTRWSEAGNAHYGHGYHSTALLLPDGSVLAAGPERNLELYRPPYLFAGERPIVESLPGTASYGETLSVTTSAEAPIARVVLIRASSVTHSLNTDQRYLALEFQRVSGRELAVQAPAAPALAPPGYYLLFVVTDRGVPSEGRFLPIG